MEYTYQVQIKRGSRWFPVINSVTGLSLQFTNLDDAYNMSRKLSLNNNKVRIVKYKYNVVKVF